MRRDSSTINTDLNVCTKEGGDDIEKKTKKKNKKVRENPRRIPLLKTLQKKKRHLQNKEGARPNPKLAAAAPSPQFFPLFFPGLKPAIKRPSQSFSSSSQPQEPSQESLPHPYF
jgi:hypothetical protein